MKRLLTFLFALCAITMAQAQDVTISSQADWDTFANNVSNGTSYSGQTVRLTNDISVTTMVGTDVHPFEGTFLGQGHTLTVNISTTMDAAAPFRFIHNVTIEHLTVEGSVTCSNTSTGNHASGLVGGCRTGETNLIRNCIVHANVTAVDYAGGIVGHSGNNTTLVMENCVYDGTISGFNKWAGGLVGWGDTITVNLRDCLVKGSFSPGSGGVYHPIGCKYYKRPATTTATACYYLNTIVPTATGDYVLPNADGIPVSETLVSGEWDNAVQAPDGVTYYAAPKSVALGDYTFRIGYDNEGEYYVIDCREALDALSLYSLSGHNCEGMRFKMTADIAYPYITAWDDPSSTENNYAPIGQYNGVDRADFKGVFDGDGHTLSGLRVYNVENAGVFCKIGASGSLNDGTNGDKGVKNLTLTDSHFSSRYGAGGIVGTMTFGFISNCHVTNTVAVHSLKYGNEYGGIVGRNWRGIITHCTSSASITSDDMLERFCGGIVGVSGGILTNNIAFGVSVPATTQNQQGAICGYSSDNIAYNYYFNCDIAGKTTNIGNSLIRETDKYFCTDTPGARLALPVSGGMDVTVALASDSGNGFVYDNIVYGGAGEQTALSLAYSGNVPSGYTVTYTDSYGNALWRNADGTYMLNLSETATEPVIITAQVASEVNPGTWTGAGTNADPYTIHNSSQLDQLAADVNAGNDYGDTYFQLGTDIVYNPCLANNYTPIGDATHAFQGHFSGNGHSISGIRIDHSADNCQALFGHVGSNATVSGLFLDDATIVGNENCGALFGLNEGATLSNNYYHACVIGNNSTNIGSAVGDISTNDAALALYRVFTKDSISVTGNATVAIGSIDYYKSGTEIAVSYNGTTPEGYLCCIAVNDSSVTDTFSMPSKDAIVFLGGFDMIPMEGSGTKDDPYIIRYSSQLSAAMRSNRKFKLGNDIVLPHTTAWDDPTSTETNFHVTSFSGTLDGDGHTISGLRIYRGSTVENACCIGFCCYLYGTITNLTIADTRITGYKYVGCFAGEIQYGTIRGCRVADNVAIHAVHTGALCHGGIAGHIPDDKNGVIENCISSVKLSKREGLDTYYQCGGIVGDAESGTVSNNFVIGANVPLASSSGRISYLFGAVFGDSHLSGVTWEHNYYYGCTVAGIENNVSMGMGMRGTNSNSDYNEAAVAVSPLTLSNGITASAPAITYEGTNYYTHGSIVLLSGGLLEGNPAEGEIDGYKLNFSGRSLLVTQSSTDGNYYFAMPEAPAAVSAVRKAHPWTGSGTSADPFVITTPEGLDLLGTLVNVGNNFIDTHFRLGADIVYPYTTAWNSDESFFSNYTAIGGDFTDIYNYSTNISPDFRFFEGTFDGAGHTISGIRIYKYGSNSYDGTQGIFGLIGENATVKNVTLADARIIGVDVVGGITGYNLNTVTNCHVADNVAIRTVSLSNSTIEYFGGIAGYNYGTITHCTSAATLFRADETSGRICYYFGGIVGENIGGTLSHNLVVGVNINAQSPIGAIIGDNTGGTLTANYYHDCTVTGNATGVGVGRDSDTQSSHDCDGARIAYAIVPVTGSSLAPAGTATTICPYDGIQVFCNGLLYKGLFYSNRGDMTADGRLSVADVTALVNSIRNNSYEAAIADVDGDGTVEENDVEALAKGVVGK